MDASPKRLHVLDVPENYKLDETHPDLLRLTEILLYPWYPSSRTDFEKPAKGTEMSLSFLLGLTRLQRCWLCQKKQFLVITVGRSIQSLITEMQTDYCVT